ncbi:hypothetical protein PZA11_007036 [Diplocarpon coronariae]
MVHPPSFKRVLVNSILFLAPTISAQYPTALQTCLNEAGVKNITPLDSTWTDATTPWQLRLKDEVKPVGVAYPANVEQLASSLACARKNSVKVSALAGGHSFVAFGYGNPGNLVVSMAAFNNFSYDKSTKLFTMGGGSRVGPALKTLWDGHGRHFPHVRSARVGIAGSSIGGGFGTTSRLLGTAMDAIESVEYMLYNGTIVKAGAGSDLLFAAKGAGSSFGVLTSLTTKTWKPTYPTAINYTVDLGSLTIDTAINALLSVQEFATTEAPEELSLRWSLRSKYSFAGFYYGEPSTFDAIMKPLLDRLPKNATVTKNELDFWVLEDEAAAGINLPDGGSSPGRTFYTQSLAVSEDHLLTYDIVKALFQATIYDFKFEGLKASGYLDMWGGYSRKVSDSDDSYVHGKNLWLVRLDTNTANATSPWPAGAIDYARSVMKPFEDALVAAGAPLRGFGNYRDLELTLPEWSSRLYGDNFAKLKSLKAAYDPEGLFTNNAQSIPL